MNDKIVDSVSFHCGKCESDKLKQPGAARTLSNRLYIVFVCGKCGAQVPIEIDKIIAELYKGNLGPESGSVN